MYSQEEDRLVHLLNLPRIENEGEFIKVKNMMLMDNDTKFILTPDQQNNKEVY